MYIYIVFIDTLLYITGRDAWVPEPPFAIGNTNVYTSSKKQRRIYHHHKTFIAGLL